ncbi:hypothetical protein, conserved [Eimeria acervulina]|uniref:TPR domain-containing protein n=1 Tax=Eimeria acervulina TaxID=5801 RepID=U6GIW2_EIMAC|nr:hypothetical protein, conserved [Eimeria acervulina]CDI79502.1 hypothetical protein, conserved [Eimeria acervulina]
MAMHECEAYWQDFLRRPKEQRQLREEQKNVQKETASRMAAQKAAKVAEIETALGACTPEQQDLLRPIFKYPGILERLHDCLVQAERNPSLFSEKIQTDEALNALIREKAEEFKQNPKAFALQEQQLQQLHEEATRGLDAAEMEYLNQRTWKDLPQAELAERMSKGEICPRDEWIPGISKGKRPLEGGALEEHLSFGDRLSLEGRQAYAAGDYETAFMRFKQGIELLNWVEARDKENQQKRIDEAFSLFLKNAAQAAIQLGKYQEAIRACTTVIQEIDEHDSKARYRRGKAYLLLGMTKSAKDDFMFILKSPYSTNEGVHAARLGLQELRSVVNKNEIEAKRTLHRGISGCLFSQGRNTSKETDNLNIAADKESEKYEEDKPQLQSHLLHADDEHAEEFRLPPSKATEHTFNEKIKQRNPKRFIYEDEDISDQATTPEAETRKGKENKAEGPPLSLEKTRNILIDFLDAYTSEPVASKLRELRSLADFDYKRVIIRCRKYLPEVQRPILQKHGVGTSSSSSSSSSSSDSHRCSMRLLEKSVSFWRFRDEAIEELTRDCLQAVFGDVADIDA